MKYLGKTILFTITILALCTSSALLQNFIPPHTAKAISVDQRVTYDKLKGCTADTAQVPTMEQFPRYFNCGHVTFYPNGTTLRQYTMIIEENHKIPITLSEDTQKPIMFPAWTFNASIPGPTLRMTQGDHIQIKVINKGTMPHSMHMHSIHPGNMDGVPIISGDSGFISPGQSFTYKFVANPIGIFPYHCHMSPVSQHINRGLFGGLIIDPQANNARPAAQEIVMYLNGYDLNIKQPIYPRFPTFAEANAMMSGNDSNARELFDKINNEHDNSIYTVNGVANYYMHHPIALKIHEPVRIYMFNMLDFEENSFHLHGQVFQYYPSATSKSPMLTGDMLVLGQGDRGLIETQFDLPGQYMSHAHQEQIGARGWSSLFSVK